MRNKRVIAINLPQFHPFKENNEWWGKGFTEWTNVTKAKPRYEGHYQPHLPSDTGFYDLRLPESRQLQADLAKEYGIYGFCYYHYWFNGKQLMERPVNEILASGEPDFPFMLCWANENWARNWDGGFTNVLIKQEYSEQDDVEHMRWLCRNIFTDKRYIKVSNKPVFAVYRSELFPDFNNTISTWRKIAREEFGMDIYIIDVIFPGSRKNRVNTDASMDFQPIGVFDSNLQTIDVKMSDKFDVKPSIYNYKEYVDYSIEQTLPNHCYPCVSPGFDNSPRRVGKPFLAFENCSPSNFGRWLYAEMKRPTDFKEDEENFVFINAWNEWAEGNHLEPDRRWRRGYLEATKRAIECFTNDEEFTLGLMAEDKETSSSNNRFEDINDSIEKIILQNEALLEDNTKIKKIIAELEVENKCLAENYKKQEQLLHKCQKDYAFLSEQYINLKKLANDYKKVYNNKYSYMTHQLSSRSKLARYLISLNINALKAFTNIS